MRCLIYSDVHWSVNSSIVRSRGESYSTRLENLIESVNWVEQLAWNQGCEAIICCGDFFDSSVLNCEEISALQEVQWAPVSHVFLTGNHETTVSSLEYSTTDLFKLCPNSCVISFPQQYYIDNTSVEFCFLPYITERDRQSLESYFGQPTTKRVIFSHNDLKNVQYGSFLSTEGFEVEEIENITDLYFNGHIHHCCNVTSKIINVGNLTGQNFTEDASKYAHCAIVLDTETLEYKFYQNLYAFKFYKLDLSEVADFEEIKQSLNQLQTNSVLTCTVPDFYSEQSRVFLEDLKSKNIVREYRLLLKHDSSVTEDHIMTINTADHLSQFQAYVLDNIGNTDVVREELATILR